MELPTLYAKASTGKTKQWRGWTEDGTMFIEHGYIDGKKQTTSKTVKGKNIGRANETTPEQQAESELQSKFNKKVDEGYTENIQDTNKTVFLPMLAHPFDKYKHKIVYPCLVQPKLNGVRCLADYDPSYMSRKGKEYNTLGHLDKEVMEVISHIGLGAVLDGEIFNPEWSFQEITRAVKKERDNTNQLQFWVYDIVDPETEFIHRNDQLAEAFKAVKTKNLVLTPTYVCNSEEHAMELHAKFTKEGYEGIIIRNAAGKYKLKHRSHDLLKYKTFLDNEFEITGFYEGTGLEKGAIVFVCKTKQGKEFHCRPKGSRETRRRWFEDGQSIIGKQLTIRYQELSEDGIPVFPVGLAVRDYEG